MPNPQKPEVPEVMCPSCKQVFFSASQMTTLEKYLTDQPKGDMMYGVNLAAGVILDMRILCKHCGRTVYWKLDEQRLNLLLRHIKTNREEK